MERFRDKAVVVTGAASGIGRATAERLASEGARVVCADLNREGADEVAKAIRETGARAEAVACDVSDPDACADLVRAAVAQLGRLDVLCNVAGVGRYAHVADVTREEWSRILAVNLSGTFFTCQAALPHLLETRGNVVNVASSAGLVGIPYASAYCASKGGVVLLTRSLAVELASRGVRVNCVCPGGVDTPLLRGFELPEGADAKLFARMQLMTRLAKPEELAGAVAYLASDEARFVTGEALSIDGGQRA